MARPSALLPPRQTNAPLESVVIPTPASSPQKNSNTTNTASSSSIIGKNIQVIIRLRPLLPSDSSSAATAKRITRSTTRHTSGLITPTNSSNNSPSFANNTHQSAWHTPTPYTIIQNPTIKRDNSISGKSDVAYTFDRVYGCDSTNTDIYRCSVGDVVKSCVEGFHGSVFAYGQTNSGKTHTMTGSRQTNQEGIIRLAVEDIFRLIQTQSNTSNNNQCSSSREYLLRVSYLEIYNEQIYDLLAPQSGSGQTNQRFGASGNNLQHHHLPPSTTVRIFESRTEGVQIRGLREEIVTCPRDVYSLLDVGDARRKVGSTGMNSSSSRSHSVFRLVLESRTSSRSGGGGGSNAIPPSSSSSMASDADSVTSGRSSVTQSLGTAVKGPVRISSLSLVDLAGSESIKATGSTGVRQKEGQFINKSLLTLGHVVHKLSEISARAEKQNDGLLTPKEHIPYRDSKLTRLLQPSLGGNARVCIVCNVSPAISSVEESHNTLKFGSRAKTIQQHASITEVADEKTLLRSYREEIEELKRQLKEAKKTAAEANMHQTPHIVDRTSAGSSSDEDDQDDTHVLVSAIKNLESLILKTGAKSTVQKSTIGGTPLVDGNTMDTDALPSRRSLDADLKRVDDKDTEVVKASLEKDSNLIEELHRIQGMLGTVMKKRKEKMTTSTNGKKPTPMDEEVEKLRIQLQEQEITTTMRKADSSFLQAQLAEKDKVLDEVWVLLDALEKRQASLEQENQELKKELEDAKALIKQGDIDKSPS